MSGTITKDVKIYLIAIASQIYDGFKIEPDFISAEKDILTHLLNPNIRELRRKFKRFGCMKFTDQHSAEQEPPVHIIIGVPDYWRVKTTERSVLGPNPDKDPGIEFIMLGWTLAGNNILIDTLKSTEKSLYMNLSKDEFKRMISLEVLSISDEKNTANSLNTKVAII